MSAAAAGRWAIGIDLGGTKTEAILLDAAGGERWRQRIATAAGSYAGVLDGIAQLVAGARAQLPAGAAASVGIGGPGALTQDQRLKNANTTLLNGQPIAADLGRRLGQPVVYANDANCLALSEATDGAGRGAAVVFAAILGTGCGAGIAVQGQVLTGPNRLAGEWGHNPLPWAEAEVDGPPPACYCGRSGCIEAWLSGPAISADHQRRHGSTLSAAAIALAADGGDAHGRDSLARWQQRLARALASVINLLDPDVIVLGGGLSRIASTYAVVPSLWPQWVLSGGVREPVRTRLLPALHGDASGVRGAAWLGRSSDYLSASEPDHGPAADP